MLAAPPEIAFALELSSLTGCPSPFDISPLLVQANLWPKRGSCTGGRLQSEWRTRQIIRSKNKKAQAPTSLCQCSLLTTQKVLRSWLQPHFPLPLIEETPSEALVGFLVLCLFEKITRCEFTFSRRCVGVEVGQVRRFTDDQVQEDQQSTLAFGC